LIQNVDCSEVWVRVTSRTFNVSADTVGDPAAPTPAGNEAITLRSIQGFGGLVFSNQLGVRRTSGGIFSFWAKVSNIAGTGTVSVTLEGGSFTCQLGPVTATGVWTRFDLPLAGCAGVAGATINQVVVQNGSGSLLADLAIGDVHF
jgi:hypothetical protein